MATILITFGVPSEGFYQNLSEHTINIPQNGMRYTEEELFSLLPTADAIVACTPLTREMIAAAGRLKLVVCYGAGYDAIDLSALRERGIMLCNIPDSVTAPTAELAIAHITNLARRLTFFHDLLRQPDSSSAFCIGKNMGTSLAGATLGIIGMGRIGGKVADFGRVMGMKVLYTAHGAKPEREALGEHYVSLPELMAQADFISIHCPCTAETKGMINGEMLELMKPTAYLINTSRGAVVDEPALLHALKTRRIAGAGLDVFVSEPTINPAFLKLDNVALTPHSGSNTAAARREMADQVSERILTFLAGKAPKNIIIP
ncbi:MAG: NAD(P)-dependent oxidoreductase [Eubacteriales bacterium]|nr:NAD(P)-dependent oxidoreductase [Eubacteriales bacterium]